MPARPSKSVEPRHLEAGSPHVDGLAREIANALMYLGGAAHRDRVVDCIGAFRRQRGEPVDPGLRAEVIETFERYCADWSSVDHALFFLPYGAGSHRWALSANSRGQA